MKENNEHAKKSTIKVSGMDCKFVQKFKCRGDVCEAFNVVVADILPRTKNRKFRFNDNKEHIYSKEHIVLQSSNQFSNVGSSISDGHSSDDDNFSSSDEDYDDDAVEMAKESSTKTTKESEAQTSRRLFVKMCRHSFDELESFARSNEDFSSAMKMLMGNVAER